MPVYVSYFRFASPLDPPKVVLAGANRIARLKKRAENCKKIGPFLFTPLNSRHPTPLFSFYAGKVTIPRVSEEIRDKNTVVHRKTVFR